MNELPDDNQMVPGSTNTKIRRYKPEPAERKYKMPNEGDTPGPCCNAMPLAIAREGDFPIAWRVDEMNCLDNQSFTGFGLVLFSYGYYPGEVYEEYAPVKFCPFCGAELKP